MSTERELPKPDLWFDGKDIRGYSRLTIDDGPWYSAETVRAILAEGRKDEGAVARMPAPIVAVGQVWRDLDKRMHGRRGIVVDISESGRIATLRIINTSRTTKIAVEGMTGGGPRQVTRRWVRVNADTDKATGGTQ